MNQSPDKGDFGTLESAQRLDQFCSEQLALLDLMRDTFLSKDDSVWDVVTPLTFAAVDSGKSFLLLARAGKHRDAYILARTVYETLVNVCFICASGDVVAQRARTHALQKAFRDLNRQVDVDDQSLSITCTVQPTLAVRPELQSALAEFTGRKGREISSWTPETVHERVEVVHKVYGTAISTSLQFGLASIYRHASEMLHGTLFGARFALGCSGPSAPPKDPAALERFVREHICMLLLMVGLSVDATIRVLGDELELCDFVQNSKKRVDGLKTLSWFQLRDGKTS